MGAGRGRGTKFQSLTRMTTFFRQTPPHKGSITVPAAGSKCPSTWGGGGQYTFRPQHLSLPSYPWGRKNWLTLSSLVTNGSEYFHAFFIGHLRIVFGEMSTETLCSLWSSSSYRVIRVSVHTRYFSILIICIHFPILRFVVLYLRVPFTIQTFSLEEAQVLFCLFCFWLGIWEKMV